MVPYNFLIYLTSIKLCHYNILKMFITMYNGTYWLNYTSAYESLSRSQNIQAEVVIGSEKKQFYNLQSLPDFLS